VWGAQRSETCMTTLFRLPRNRKPSLALILISLAALCTYVPLVKAPAENVATSAFISVEPNPVGVWQTVRIYMRVEPAPPTPSDIFLYLIITVKQPDGTSYLMGPFMSYPNGSAYCEFVPIQVGIYRLHFNYSGQYFANSTIWYMPSMSPEATLTVTQEPVISGIQIVDSTGNVGPYSSLALDSDGNPHISYFDISNHALKYASRWGSSDWVTETVDSGDVGVYCSLALDSNNNPHISYCDLTEEILKYASWNGSGWKIENVSTGGGFTSLALDSSDNPHISCNDDANNGLKYSSFNGSGWHSEIVDSAGWSDMGDFSSLALDSSDRAHISYYYYGTGDLLYAVSSGSSWNITTVNPFGDVGFYSSLALDSNGNAHISYQLNGVLRYSYWNGSGWNFQMVDSTYSVGAYSSLALDSEGDAHISYYDGANADLRYARWNGSNWDIRIIDSQGDVGKYSSLALGPGDGVHIGYFDETNDDLKHAVFTNPADFPPSPPLYPPSTLITQQIKINADGSISPPTAPILTTDNITYTLTNDVYFDFPAHLIGCLCIERNNTVFNGAGHTLNGGMNDGFGIELSEPDFLHQCNVTIANTTITRFSEGVCVVGDSNTIIENNIVANKHIGIKIVSYSSSNMMIRNNITGTTVGISIGPLAEPTSNHTIIGNNIRENQYAMYISWASGNKVYHNNFVNNTQQVYPSSSDDSTNIWDNGYPSGGNYWSDYNGTDNNEDGIGDSPYVINANNTDNYPLMAPFAPVIYPPQTSPSPSPSPSSSPVIPETTPLAALVALVVVTCMVAAVTLRKHNKKPNLNPRQ